MKNTLLIGNGFNLSLYSNVPKWADLFKDEKEHEINNYTFLYEACLLKSKDQDDKYKEKIIKRFSDFIKTDNIRSGISDVECFGKHLEEHQIENLLTTNMDTGIESILTEKNDYSQIDNDSSEEKIYSVRRRKTYINKEESHKLNIWKIHGDVDKIPSVSFGFDQYCGSLSKIDDYVKGKYFSSDGKTECTVPIKKKCENASFDDISWIELFFTTNVYIACFGMDFSEIDLWWLLNKRCRFINQGIPINNKIVFLYSEYDTGETKTDLNEKAEVEKTFKEKIYMLKTLGVECRRSEANDSIIANIFNQID